jgi:hypothetical protein
MNFGDFITKSLEFFVIGGFILGADITAERINEIRNSDYISSPYTSKEEVEKDFYSEKKKLGLEGVPIYLNFINGQETAFMEVNNSRDKYWVSLNLYKSNRFVLRHEFCHVKSFKSESISSKLYESGFPILRRYEEWKATSCALEE